MGTFEPLVTQHSSAYGRHRSWHAKINLEYADRPHKTVLSDMSFKGPLRVQRPFYPEGKCCHTYLLHPPGGMVSGDRIDININALAGSHALITTPSAGKIYGTDSQDVAQQQNLSIKVEPNAVVEWLPQENILFDRAKARLTTKIDLAKGARFIAWDMLSFGRPAGNYWFNEGSLQQQFRIDYDGRPIAIENFQTDQSLEILTSDVGLMGFLNMATMYIVGDNPDASLARVRSLIDDTFNDELLVAATAKPNLVTVRALSKEAEPLRNKFYEMWQQVRLEAIGAEASLPRIWLT